MRRSVQRENDTALVTVGLRAERVEENLDCREDRVDCLANHSLSACRRVLNPKGTYVMAGGPGGRWMTGLWARAIAAPCCHGS